MDIKRGDDSNWHFKLGPIERVAVGGGFALLVFLLSYVFHSFDTRLEAQDKTMQSVVTSQAVTNAQLQTLNQQLSDVPGLTRQMAELKVNTDRNTQDIHELQQVRHLK
jgi:hypothetical protein